MNILVWFFFLPLLLQLQSSKKRYKYCLLGGLGRLTVILMKQAIRDDHMSAHIYYPTYKDLIYTALIEKRKVPVHTRMRTHQLFIWYPEISAMLKKSFTHMWLRSTKYCIIESKFFALHLFAWSLLKVIGMNVTLTCSNWNCCWTIMNRVFAKYVSILNWPIQSALEI